MKSCDFRRAVIGRNELADEIWPVVSESNRNNRSKHKRVPHGSELSENASTNTPLMLPNSRPASLSSDSNESREQSQTEINFPELSKSIMLKNDRHKDDANELTDKIWPALSESNRNSRSKHKKMPHGSEPLENGSTSAGSLTLPNSSPSSLSSDNLESREQSQTEINFTELSKSITLKNDRHKDDANEFTDKIQPTLNESNRNFKSKHKKKPHGSEPLKNGSSNAGSLTLSDSIPSSLSSHKPKSREQSQTANFFPELSKSVTLRNDRDKDGVKSNQISNQKSKRITTDSCTMKKVRNPKYLHEIKISLRTLLRKRPVQKRLLLPKNNVHKMIICGNKLDRDNPMRKKGKIRLHQRKYLTQIKKDIVISKTLKRRLNYNLSFHKAKCFFPSLLSSFNNFDAVNFESLLGTIQIAEVKDRGDNDKNNDKSDSREINIKQERNCQNTISSTEVAKTILHSKSFKKYCRNLVTPNLLKNLQNLIIKLRKFQDKQHAKNPEMTLAKRRYLCGFRETKRFIACGDVKAAIIATDLEIDPDLPSGSVISEIEKLAEQKCIPVIYAGKGKQLGYWTLKKRRISIIGILKYDGADQLYHELVKSWEESRASYKKIIEEIEEHLPKHLSPEEMNSEKEVEEELRDSIISKLSADIADLENICAQD